MAEYSPTKDGEANYNIACLLLIIAASLIKKGTVVKSKLVVEQITDLGAGVVKLIEARKRSQPK